MLTMRNSIAVFRFDGRFVLFGAEILVNAAAMQQLADFLLEQLLTARH